MTAQVHVKEISVHWLVREQVSSVPKLIIKAESLWSFGSLQQLWVSGEKHNSHLTWFSREINTHSLSDLQLRSWLFAVVKNCRTPLSRAAPLIKVSYSHFSFAFLCCVLGLCTPALSSSAAQPCPAAKLPQHTQKYQVTASHLLHRNYFLWQSLRG